MVGAEAYWEHFPHGADVGVRGVGTTLAEAFEQAALALSAVMVPLESIARAQQLSLTCEAPDAELLLVDWLNAIIYEIATRRMLFGHYEVAIEGNRLTAILEGEALDTERHRPTVEVKGATYTALSVSRQGDRWVAQCVVDV